MRRKGFTLVEMVLVIVLTGALFAGAGIFIIGPTTAYADLSRRAMLVDAADLALRRMARDIRAAVPNSIRATGGTLTMFNAVSGGRYRAALDSTDASITLDNVLEFDADDERFDVPGGFPGFATLDSTAHWLVVYNLDTPGADVYAGDKVITPDNTRIEIAGDGVTLTPGHRFQWQSPEQRIYLSDGTIAYSCPDGRLLRSVNGDAAATVTANVTGCVFAYAPGTASRSGVVTIRITLEADGETISLLRQVQVENLP